jgi:GTP cyclohydrolase IA
MQKIVKNTFNILKKPSTVTNLAAITRYPSPIAEDAESLSKEEKIALIAEHFHDIMQILGLDLTDESLAKTPKRVARMYVNEIFSGLDLETFPDISLLDEECATEQNGQSLILTRVSFTSFCEHHFVPMHGHAFVGYMPNGKLLGLSKIHRIVRFFAARPQLQERLTSQIADSLSTILESDNIAVAIQAQHFCVIARGVQDDSGITSTSTLLGNFKNDPTKKEEFFNAIERQKN